MSICTRPPVQAAQITQAWLKAFEACIELMDAGSEPACRHAAGSKALIDVLLYLRKSFSVPNMLLGVGIEHQPDVAVKRLHESANIVGPSRLQHPAPRLLIEGPASAVLLGCPQSRRLLDILSMSILVQCAWLIRSKLNLSRVRS